MPTNSKRPTKDEYLQEFLRSNTDLQTTHSNGVEISFESENLPDDKISSSFPAYITINIRIYGPTTIDQIREAWPLVTQWRERLQEYQPSLGKLLKQRFLEHKEAGYSYKQIADVINAEIEGYIRVAYESKLRDKNYPIEAPVLSAAGLMMLMGMDSNDVSEWIGTAFRNLADGIPMFPPDYPVGVERVRERLRKWPKEIKPNRAIEFLLHAWIADVEGQQ